jgi:hypothetical protein
MANRSISKERKMHNVFSHLRGFMYYEFFGSGIDTKCYFGPNMVGDGYGTTNGSGSGYGFGYGNCDGGGSCYVFNLGAQHYGDGNTSDEIFSTDGNE